MTQSYEKCVWPENITEEQKQYFIAAFKDIVERETQIYMFYQCECGTDTYESVLLDRFPMSETIIFECVDCKKLNHCHPVVPYEFYLPLTKQIFSLEDLKEMMIVDGPQAEFLKAYRDMENPKKFTKRKLKRGPNGSR